MDFTPQLIAFQGAIISADNVHSFSRLTAKGGNQEQFKYVIQCIKNFLIKEKYANENSLLPHAIENIRKFAFYIILNADLQVLETMVEKAGIDFLIWTIPTIPNCLMCEMFWKLHMDVFVHEIISFCQPQMALEVAESFKDHIKYLNPMESYKKVKALASGCYTFICRLNFFIIEKNMISSATNQFQKCLKYFVSPPNCSKLEILSNDQLTKYKGEIIYCVLLLLYDCLEQFTGIQKFQLDDILQIYMLTYEENNLKSNLSDIKICDSSDKAILDCLHTCHEELLNVCKELVMDVNLYTFCTWSEFEVNGKSMQQTIGEMTYKLRNKLMNIESLKDHPIVPMLQELSCKPKEIEDIINDTNTLEICEIIGKNNNDKTLWVRALLNRNKLCHDTVLIQNLISNLHTLQEEDYPQLYKICLNHTKSSMENIELVKLLAIKAFHFCNYTIKHNMLQEHFSHNCLKDDMETTEFNNMLTEIFNKFIATPELDLSDVLSVFIQNPKQVYNKVFTLATENTYQCNIMANIMKYLERYSNYYYSHDTEPCIIRSTENIIVSSLNSEASQSNFLRFIRQLKNENILAGTKLLLLIIMPLLHQGLLNKNINLIHLQVKMLNEVFTLKELAEYRAPLLAMLAQVMDVVRWKIDTFLPQSPSCLDTCIELQISLMNTYKNEIPEGECKWLKCKVKKLNPLNMYYYRKLWNPPGNTYLETITGLQVHKQMEIEQLKVSLSQLLCSTTKNEWYQLWDSLLSFETKVIFEMFHDALLLISAAEKHNRIETTWSCLLYCYQNFTIISRYKFLTDPVIDSKVLKVVDKISITINSLEEDEIKEFQAIFEPLLAYMGERNQDHSVEIFKYIHDHVKHKKFTDGITKLFNNGTS